MSFPPLHKPKVALIYTRRDPSQPSNFTPRQQEDSLRRYCVQNRIRVAGIRYEECGSLESVEALRQFAASAPEDVDSIFAARVYCLSCHLYDLYKLCQELERKGITVYSLELSSSVLEELAVLYEIRFNDL